MCVMQVPSGSCIVDGAQSWQCTCTWYHLANSPGWPFRIRRMGTFEGAGPHWTHHVTGSAEQAELSFHCLAALFLSDHCEEHYEAPLLPGLGHGGQLELQLGSGEFSEEALA